MTFLEKNQGKLTDYARMSQALGARADYVQGGGGNTSVKLADGRMGPSATFTRVMRLHSLKTPKKAARL